MDWKLELIAVPVSDVDRAKSFYLDQLGFELLVDHSPNDSFRIVQMVPPGSACAIAFGKGLKSGEPGSVRACISSSTTSKRRAASSSVAERP